MRNKVLDYFNQDNLATDVFISKYSLNKQEVPDEMHERLAEDFARIEEKYHDIYLTKDIKALSDYGQRRFKTDNFSSVIKGKIVSLFNHFDFIIPGGSVMQGLGSGKPVSLSNCFVLQSPEDTIESIFNTARDAAQIYKRRGGVGIDISNLRPRGSGVDNAANSSTGAVSFMDLYSNVTNIICQEGRRGALMISIDVNHPDVFEFANIKKDLTKITGANISIRLNDKFLEAVKNNKDYLLYYPSNIELTNEEYYCIHPETSQKEYNELITYCQIIGGKQTNYYVKRIKAKELWDNIITNAHLTAEPGIFNWERLVNYDPTGVYNELKPISTNPCGELGLSGYDSCRLIATNLYSLVENPFTNKAALDTIKAYEVFYEAQVLADNLVDLELEAVDKILTKINPLYLGNGDWHQIDDPSDEFKLWMKIREIGSKGRRTGTGITAYADMLAALNKSYGDIKITEKIFKIKLQAELDASIDMAIIRGPFPLYNRIKEYSSIRTSNAQVMDINSKVPQNDWYKFIQEELPEQYKRMYIYSRRNAGISTIAPTGTVSIMTQTTSGIEPVFLPVYTRRVTCLSDETPDIVENGIGYKEVTTVHPKLKTWYEIAGYQIFEQHLGEGLNQVPKVEELTKKDWDYLYPYSPYYLQSSADLDYNVRVDTQALIQKYITSSISSTVNLPSDVTKEVVEDLYIKAFEKGCKGITVYRDGSRSGILIGDKVEKSTFTYNKAPKRGKELEAHLHITKSKGNIYAVIVGLKEDKPYEVFVFNTLNIPMKESSGKIIKVKKGHYKFEGDNITIEKLDETGNTDLEKACALYTSMLLRHGANIHYVIKTAKKIDDGITSFVSAMCRVLNKYDEIKETLECPKCGGRLVKDGGCSKCIDCGESMCG